MADDRLRASDGGNLLVKTEGDCLSLLDSIQLCLMAPSPKHTLRIFDEPPLDISDEPSSGIFDESSRLGKLSGPC